MRVSDLLLDEDLKVAGRNSLLAYILLNWNDYQVHSVHRIIAEKLEAVERGEIKRLAISVPPRHGKSTLISEYFPAWYLGKNPDHQVITASYSHKLAEGFGRKVRNQLQEPVFNCLFPGCNLSSDSKSVQSFATDERGIYIAVGVGGTLTGKGANCFIIDDPIKNRAEANSQIMRERLLDFYKSTAYTRLQPGGSIILCQTRWHEDDLMGWLKENGVHEDWYFLNLPVLNANDEPLCPEFFDSEALVKMKTTVGQYEWQALYMGEPSSYEGNLIKKNWWQFYNKAPGFERLIWSWDLAFKAGKRNDYSVGTLWGLADNGFYLRKMVKTKAEYSKIKELIVLNYMQSDADAILIEDAASGQSVIQDLQRTRLPIVPIKIGPRESKVNRVNAISAQIQAGNVRLPHGEIWAEEVIEEFASFPVGRHDDIVDSCSQAINYLVSGLGSYWVDFL
tara:strand:+ start:951 stop:2300 length:1350 start_codon:yes stop_codon:yes gene_type:complete